MRAHAGRPDSNKNFQLPPKIKRPNLHIVRYTCQYEQYQLHTQNERRAHPNWAPTKEPKCELLEIYSMIQLPPEMDENWLRYELLNLGQIYETKLAEDVVLCVHNTTSALNR